jgi:hypothetical protein
MDHKMKSSILSLTWHVWVPMEKGRQCTKRVFVPPAGRAREGSPLCQKACLKMFCTSCSSGVPNVTSWGMRSEGERVGERENRREGKEGVR